MRANNIFSFLITTKYSNEHPRTRDDCTTECDANDVLFAVCVNVMCSSALRGWFLMDYVVRTVANIAFFLLDLVFFDPTRVATVFVAYTHAYIHSQTHPIHSHVVHMRGSSAMRWCLCIFSRNVRGLPDERSNACMELIELRTNIHKKMHMCAASCIQTTTLLVFVSVLGSVAARSW